MPPTRSDKVLVIGGGGREHALAWALAHSPDVAHVYVAPGNAGTHWAASDTAAAASNVPLAADDLPALLAFAQANQIALTVVGPEQPLAAGIVDLFQAAGMPIFGPTQAASELEASKSFAKAFMQQHGIPTAAYASFTDYEAARAYLLERAREVAPQPYGVVVKADGLAAGKGVLVCATAAEAVTALHSMMVERVFGAAGERVVIEERLAGPEVSVMGVSDGSTVIALPAVRDHKRVYEGDEGLNTGGMGAFTPVPDVDSSLLHTVEQQVLQPMIDGMAARGTPYVGVLYAGLMLTEQGLRVLEFNCRFGDPEAQTLVPLIRNLYGTLQACVQGTLTRLDLELLQGACATIVLTAPGYPGTYPTGAPISGLDRSYPHVTLFHAGTAHAADGQIVTNGGRVLAVSGTGATLHEALDHCYAAVDQIYFKDMHFRRDIGRTKR